MSMLGELDERAKVWTQRFWTVDIAALPWPSRTIMATARVGASVGNDLAAGQLSLRAMSLVYTTLLSLVPLLAVSFSVLQAFGVHNQLDSWLVGLLEPLGEEALRISSQIVSFVENVNVRVLGSFGLVILIYMVVSLTQKVEAAVNHTWRIRSTRGFFERFTHYLSVILVGPLLVVAAISFYASVMTSDVVQEMAAVEPFGALRANLTKAVPYFLVIAAFTFVYVYIPYTRVRISAAIAGGIVAGILWSLAGAAFARFVVSSTAYAAIYSSFAIIVLFLIWLYVGWLILLTGAAVSFYCQHPEHRGIRVDQLELSAALRERLGLEIMARVARGFAEADRGTHAKRLATDLNTPLDHIRLIIKDLVNGGFLIRIQSVDERYVPAQDVSCIAVAAVLETVRGARREQTQKTVNRQTERVDTVVSQINDFVQQSVGSMTVRDLLIQDTPTAARSDKAQDAAQTSTSNPTQD